MRVVVLPNRLLARRTARRLLLEGRGHMTGLDLGRAEAVLRQALQVAREGGADDFAGAAGEALTEVLLRRRRPDEAEAALDRHAFLPVFEGEPLPDFALPGLAVAARAC